MENWQRLAGGVQLLKSEQQPRALLCFAGAALVGAAPHITYSRFLRQLSERGFWVLALPYGADLDFVAVADALELALERALGGPEGLGALPLWRVGHSLGALAQVLAACRHQSLRHRGQILVSYTRRGEEALPIVRTALSANPLLGPLLKAMDVPAASDFLAKGYDFAERALKGAGLKPSPVVQDLMPVVQQLLPLLKEVGAEREEFRPSASRFLTAVKNGYKEPRTLLIRLDEDDLDETAVLLSALATLPASRGVELSLRILPGQHLLPLFVEPPPAIPGPSSLRLPGPGGRPALSVREARERWESEAEKQTAIVEAIDSFISQNS